MSNYVVSDTDLTSVANAIRAKSGRSDQLAFPAGFVSEIGNIQSGGSSDTLEVKGVASVDLLYETGFPVKYKITSEYIDTIAIARSDTAPARTLGPIEEIEVSQQSTPQNFGATILGNFRNTTDYSLKLINFNNLPIGNIYTFSFVYNRALQFESLLNLNLSKVGGGNYKIGTMSNMVALKNVTVKPNTLGQLDLIDQSKNWWNISSAPLLTDSSLISIANGLCSTYTSKIQLHSTPKTRCSVITGTVSQVTDDTGTYDFFTEDANGTVTLADFITTIKGWTLA